MTTTSEADAREHEQIIRPTPEQMHFIKAQHDRMQKEWENRPELFTQEFDCNDILRCAHAVREARQHRGESVESIGEKYTAFAAQYPVIFEKCCTPDFPLTMLPVLLNQLRAFKNKQLSKESATDAVCKALNDKYVDPVLKDLHTPKSSSNVP